MELMPVAHVLVEVVLRLRPGRAQAHHHNTVVMHVQEAQRQPHLVIHTIVQVSHCLAQGNTN